MEGISTNELDKWIKEQLDGGLLQQNQVDQAYNYSTKYEINILDALLENRFIDEQDYLQALAQFLNLETIDLTKVPINKDAFNIFDHNIYLSHKFIVYDVKDDEILVAISEPNNEIVKKLIAEKKQYRASFFLASNQSIITTVQQLAGISIENDDKSEIDISSTDENDTKSPYNNSEQFISDEDISIKPLVDLLKDAIADRASDIHLEPSSDGFDVRYRIDGSLHNIKSFSQYEGKILLNICKLLGKLDITQNRIPQSGSFVVSINGKDVPIRVSTLPDLGGESMAVRFLGGMDFGVDFNSLGIDENMKALLLNMLARPYGLFITTGATGAGKTTTLYTFLNYLTSGNKKIITIEDPVERKIPRIMQSEINPSINLTFSEIFKNILRSDPDIVAIGEVRDHETMDVAVEAAITGHLMLTTLHGQDSLSSIVRLLENIKSTHLLASVLIGVLSQHLVRRLCEQCKKKIIPDEEVIVIYKKLAKDPPQGIYQPTGCAHCLQTGYKGRIGLFELLVATPKFRELIENNVAPIQILKQCSDAIVKTIKDDALDKLHQGIVSFADVKKYIW